MSIPIMFVWLTRDANDAVDGLGSEMSRRRTHTRERQGHVRKLDSVPPVMQTCSVDSPLATSKGAGLPLPVMLAWPVTTKRTVVGGLSAGQTLAS